VSGAAALALPAAMAKAAVVRRVRVILKASVGCGCKDE